MQEPEPSVCQLRWTSADRVYAARAGERLGPCSAVVGRCASAGAFTLVELLVVIAVVGTLMAIVLGAGRRVFETGKIVRTKAELAAISSALEGYRRQYGDYPQTDDAAVMLQSLVGKLGPKQAAISGGAQIDLAMFRTAGAKDPLTAADAVLIDPWERPYLYVYKSPSSGWTNPGFVLYAVGPDGLDAPALLTGGAPNIVAAGNADNLYADQ